MKFKLHFSTFILMTMLIVLSTSCKKELRNGPTEESSLSTSINASATPGDGSTISASALAKNANSDLLKSVRRATSRFHSKDEALLAGHIPDEHCVSVPGLGGMGYHWVNPSLVDPVFDPLKPEAILYASGPGGNLRLIAVEYIVINIGQPRPSFGDQLFDIGGTPVPVPHWSLHVWLYENNPSGMFAPFNPNITCP